ncbi:zinc finger CCHC domain-containing protein 8 homolog [Phlebotomus argentipes]|uniref:zinc finger CCHC domain-containing protein 8 homolog n=1 Tax=Phlebotomus argentipes TaxID=94469 RepID=UPI0028932E5C|nr:zinc finger CCHC domain-containing protein 8 homolog [Phlebotomus argentipes]
MMSEDINFNNSDCQLLEQHVSIVNLDTTEEEEGLLEDKPKEPFLHMVFQDEEACKSLLSKIRRCVESFLKAQNKHGSVVTSESGKTVDIFAEEASESESIFTEDKKPSIRLKINEVPAYLPSEVSTLHNGELPETPQRLKKSSSCFNCGDSHTLSDCPLPRNQERIRKARMQNASSKTERYHTDIEQRFAHIKAGCVSGSLKKALGVPSNCLPAFIYRMRRLGYPPGWLEEAKISHSGLSLFDSEGRSVRSSNLEDGQICEVQEEYNPEKIIEFPGFNIDPPRGCLDESQFHGVSPMMEHHRKEVMFKMFGLQESQPGYKRQRLGELEASPPNGGMEDMEIVDECPISPAQPESNESSKETSSKETAKRDSPSLDELQAAQERLLDALNSSSSDASASASQKPMTPDNRGKSVSIMPGTPILTPFSAFSRLPDGDNWARGVSGVIDFENLPDSTGKYEKMKDVLGKVRETVGKIHRE